MISVIGHAIGEHVHRTLDDTEHMGAFAKRRLNSIIPDIAENTTDMPAHKEQDRTIMQ